MVLYAQLMDLKSQKNVCYWVQIGDAWYWKHTVPSLRRYCENHGIEFKVWDKLDDFYATKKYPNKNMKFWLQRFAIINAFARSDYDNLLMVDLDMFFNQDAPNIFDLLKEDGVYQQYAPNVMKEAGHGTADWDGVEYGNGGLYLMNKSTARSLVPELVPEKVEPVGDQKNFAWARVRAKVPFIKIENKWNYTIWSLDKQNLADRFIQNEIYFIHYGSHNLEVMKEHLKNDTFKQKALGYKSLEKSYSDIPKKIWMFWDKGLDQAPAVVKECHKAWVRLNPEWEVALLDNANLGEYIDVEKYLNDKIPMQAFSDIIRIMLLEKYGGVWVDATVFPTSPLNSWLPEAAPKGFFAFSRPKYDRTVSSWFLAAEEKSPVILSWADEVSYFWSTGWIASELLEKIYRKKTTILFKIGLAFMFKIPMKLIKKVFGVFPYFWFHYLFDSVIKENEDAAKVWDSTKKISADGPHKISKHGLEKEPDQNIKNFISENSTPVHKLSWRVNIKDGSAIDHLIKENRNRYGY